MKQKRLPFRVEMARAWHEGRKQITRRLAKVNETVQQAGGIKWVERDGLFYPCRDELCRGALDQFDEPIAPVYPVGSTVIIAEPLVMTEHHDGHEYTVYAADSIPVCRDGAAVMWPWKVNRLSGRYMPNWAARSWGRIVSVRVERLQEITASDAIAEGVEFVDGYLSELAKWRYSTYAAEQTAIKFFRLYIDHINGPGTWASNPWVFRYELEKLAQKPTGGGRMTCKHDSVIECTSVCAERLRAAEQGQTLSAARAGQIPLFAVKK